VIAQGTTTPRDGEHDQPQDEADDGASASPFSQKRAKLVATVVVALLLAGGAWLLVGEAANWSHVMHALRRVGPWWLVLAAVGSAAGYVGYAALFQVESRVADGPRPPAGVALRVTVLIFGASVLATSAGRLGSEYWALRRMGEPAPRAWSRVLAINTWLWAFLAGLAAVGGLLVLAGAGHAPEWLALVWVLVPAAMVVPALYVSSPARRHLARDAGGRVRRAFAAAVRGLVLLRETFRDGRSGAQGVLGGALIWGGELVTLWASLRAFGVAVGYEALVIGYATGFASSMLPLPAGGAGGVDAASAYALTLVGVPLGPALLATLVQRVCTYWLPLAVALLVARSVRRLSADLGRVDRPEREGAMLLALDRLGTR
jgi:uncharacterized membrane protein YbhN (UPF0104 family)